MIPEINEIVKDLQIFLHGRELQFEVNGVII